MGKRRAPSARKLGLWLLLSLPATHLLWRWRSEALWPDDLVAPSGEWAGRLLIVALMLTPLNLLLPRSPVVRWLVAHRRAFGVGAFLYAIMHLGFYGAGMGSFEAMVDELPLPGIGTGWAALALMAPLALTSTDAAMRALRAGWKRLQRLAYPAAILTLTHWLLVHDGLSEALAQAAPLIALELYRIIRALRTGSGTASTSSAPT